MKAIDFKKFVSTDSIRPHFCQVYHKGGFAYATDQRVLVRIKEEDGEHEDGTFTNPYTGKTIDMGAHKYPNADAVIAPCREYTAKKFVTSSEFKPALKTIKMFETAGVANKKGTRRLLVRVTLDSGEYIYLHKHNVERIVHFLDVYGDRLLWMHGERANYRALYILANDGSEMVIMPCNSYGEEDRFVDINGTVEWDAQEILNTISYWEGDSQLEVRSAGDAKKVKRAQNIIDTCREILELLK